MHCFVLILSLQLVPRIEFLFSETEKNKKLVTTSLVVTYIVQDGLIIVFKC